MSISSYRAIIDLTDLFVDSLKVNSDEQLTYNNFYSASQTMPTRGNDSTTFYKYCTTPGAPVSSNCLNLGPGQACAYCTNVQKLLDTFFIPEQMYTYLTPGVPAKFCRDLGVNGGLPPDPSCLKTFPFNNGYIYTMSSPINTTAKVYGTGGDIVPINNLIKNPWLYMTKAYSYEADADWISFGIAKEIKETGILTPENFVSDGNLYLAASFDGVQSPGKDYYDSINFNIRIYMIMEPTNNIYANCCSNVNITPGLRRVFCGDYSGENATKCADFMNSYCAEESTTSLDPMCGCYSTFINNHIANTPIGQALADNDMQLPPQCSETCSVGKAYVPPGLGDCALSICQQIVDLQNNGEIGGDVDLSQYIKGCSNIPDDGGNGNVVPPPSSNIAIYVTVGIVGLVIFFLILLLVVYWLTK